MQILYAEPQSFSPKHGGIKTLSLIADLPTAQINSKSLSLSEK
jgi:hypothetical protein